jgi:hypothetical protein
MPTSSQGTTITAPGLSGATVTNVQINAQGADPLEVSALSDTSGSQTFIASPFIGFSEVTVSYIGDSLPASGSTGALAVSGAISISFANSVCTGSSFSGSAGELITGTATYRQIG